MTRKDYIRIARALYQAKKDISDIVGHVSVELALELVEQRVMDELADDNPCFNRNHFLAVVRGEKPLESRPKRVKMEV